MKEELGKILHKFGLTLPPSR